LLQNLKALGSKGLISIATLIIIVLVGVGGFIGGRYCYYKAEKLLEERLVETEKGLERISFLIEEKVKLLSIIPEEYNEGLRLNTIYFNIDENPICTNSFIIQEDSIIDLTYQTLTWTSEKIIKDNRVPFLRWLEFGKTKLPSDGYYNLIYEPISKKEKKDKEIQQISFYDKKFLLSDTHLQISFLCSPYLHSLFDHNFQL